MSSAATPGRRRGRGGGRSQADAASAAADRSLRAKNASQRGVYADARDSDSDEETLKQTFSVQEKLTSPNFSMFFVREVRGEEVTVEAFQRSGFNVPLLVREKTGLGMTMPDAETFTVSDVKAAVGARRAVEVMDCTTQRNCEMTMKDFEEYYTNADRDPNKKLNVISLEFSFTKLEPYVVAPKAVRQIDWVDNVWPRHLKEQQSEVTNLSKWIKVNHNCLGH